MRSKFAPPGQATRQAWPRERLQCCGRIPSARVHTGLAAQVPAAWSLDFVVTLTFLVLLVPALRTRADLAAAVVAGAVALLAAGLPYRLSLVVASLVGIGAGFVAEWRHRR